MVSAERIGVAVTSVIIIAVATVWSIQSIASAWRFEDLRVYLGAAENLIARGNPYLPSSATTDLLHYHYAPWFAALFVPLLSLPMPLVEWGWAAILAVCAILALTVLRGDGVRALPLAALMAVLLLGQVMAGNVQSLMLAALIWRLDRRDGPVWIGMAASLKAIPIVLVLLYIGRREWGRALAALAITAVLVAPMLLFEIPEGSLWPGVTGLYAISPILWVASAVLTALLTVRLARTRFARLAAASATLAALPRFYPFDLSWALLGVPPRRVGRNE